MRSGYLAASFIASYYDYKKVPSDSRYAVAIAGRSNVGKSTLINNITQGKAIAKVSSTPGKTQALNFFMVDTKFYLVDLPGYGFAKVPEAVRKSWGTLVEGYLTASDRLRGLVFLLDCRREIQPDDVTLLEWVIAREIPFLTVLTKADKLSKNQLIQKVRAMSQALYGENATPNLIPFSAKSGIGRKEVLAWIRKAVA